MSPGWLLPGSIPSDHVGSKGANNLPLHLKQSHPFIRCSNTSSSCDLTVPLCFVNQRKLVQHKGMSFVHRWNFSYHSPTAFIFLLFLVIAIDWVVLSSLHHCSTLLFCLSLKFAAIVSCFHYGGFQKILVIGPVVYTPQYQREMERLDLKWQQQQKDTMTSWVRALARKMRKLCRKWSNSSEKGRKQTQQTKLDHKIYTYNQHCARQECKLCQIVEQCQIYYIDFKKWNYQ